MAVLKLGELLISKGLLTKEQLRVAMSQQAVTGSLLGDTLIRLGFVSSMEMGQALAEQAGIEFIDLSRYAISEDALRMVPRETAEGMGFLPLDLQDGALSIGITNPTNIRAIDTASQLCGKPPRVYMVDSETFYGMIEKAYFFLKHPIAERVEGFTGDIKKGKAVSGAMISTLAELLMMDAIRRNATDIHITPEAEALHVFCRIDGVLQHIYCLPRAVHGGIVSRLKILSNLDIAEQRLPQDGSFTFPLMNNVYEMRLSVIPTIHGENIVIRILSGSSPLLSMTGLGFDEEDTAKLKRLFSKPHGLIMVAGPTGSGKTTTLYSALREINIIERNVLTVEDPVEYKLSMVKQTQVSAKTGYDFAVAGRSFMRQDPDAMLIGEIRDEETASISIRASITGHLVLSTVHTNDAVTAVPRLIDLGVDRFLLSSALLAVIAQRLVRKVCSRCAEPRAYAPGELEKMGFAGLEGIEMKAAQGRGCAACNQTGYLGRTAIGEILIINDEIRELIYSGGSVNAIYEKAVRGGMKTMRENGIQKASKGVTTFEEVLRVVG
ncbi:MAG: GspE/PulE family protein [Deltaproteobacteria bacterium]|nr:GspE/PulE family protein [Deltaproteobacteria bacterium]